MGSFGWLVICLGVCGLVCGVFCLFCVWGLCLFVVVLFLFLL